MKRWLKSQYGWLFPRAVETQWIWPWDWPEWDGEDHGEWIDVRVDPLRLGWWRFRFSYDETGVYARVLGFELIWWS